MANYTDKEKQEVKNLFQSLVVLDQIGIREIVDGIAIPDYSHRAKDVLSASIMQMANCPLTDYMDSAKVTKPGLNQYEEIKAFIFSDLCELLADKDIHDCLKHHINYSAMIMNYEREQVEEVSGWQSMIRLDNAERVADINADDMRRTWSLFV
jgi:hypothetical protein